MIFSNLFGKSDPNAARRSRRQLCRRRRFGGDGAGAGAGADANALVGGFDRSFTLQPLSIEVQSGVALAAGVASLSLRSAR